MFSPILREQWSIINHMPLCVKEFEWSETDSVVTLLVPLKGASKKKVDIFSTNKYIKLNYPPYIFELALYSEVDAELSKATVSETQVTFQLVKKVIGKWGQLHANESNEKKFMFNLRNDALKWFQEKETEKSKKACEERDQLKKFAVQQQIKLDDEERQTRNHLKDAQMQKITSEMEDWKKSQSIDDKDNKKNLKVSQKLKAAIKNESAEYVSAPRPCGNIQVSFTPRQLTTPARESKLPEEEMWLQKVAQMNKIRETHNPDFESADEKNPMWLKDKGDCFFKQGNYVAAINAYTTGLMLDSKIPALFANRAACHLSLKQYDECIQDCSCALELYEPPVLSNALSRCRIYARRGAAFFKREQYVEALYDYETAVKLDPKNSSLNADANTIRKIIEGVDPTD